MSRSASGEAFPATGPRALLVAAALLAPPALFAPPADGAGRGVGNARMTVAPETPGGTLVLTSASPGKAGGKLRLAALLGDGATADEVASFQPDGAAAAKVAFRRGADTAEARLSVHPDGSVTVTGGRGLAGVAVLAEMEYAVVPSRWVGQTLCRAGRYPPGAEVHLPPENLLVGLLAGRGRLVVLAWPTGRQRLAVVRNARAGREARFGAARVRLGGGELHLAAFDAPGIWHRAALSKDQLEKDVDLGWDRPFAAQWVTQLVQTGVETSFVFERRNVRRWWPGVGFFQWPARFEGTRGVLRLGKKIPPVGEAVIFPLSGHPSTPFEFLRRSLSPAQRAKITELGPTKSVYNLRRRPPYVWPAHCEGNRRMQATFLAVGLHYREREFMARHIEERVTEDVAVARQARRYLDFLTGLAGRLDGWMSESADKPKLRSCLKRMRRGLGELEATYRRLMKGQTPEAYEAHIRATAERFKQAVGEADNEALAEMRSLLKALNEPKGRVENFGKDFGGGVRKWFAELAGLCADEPAAVPYAAACRQAVRQLLEYRQFEAHGRYGRDLR